MTKFKTLLILLFLLGGTATITARHLHVHSLPGIVFAEEEDEHEEEEHEDREDDEDHDDYVAPQETTTPAPKEEVQYEEVQVYPAPQVSYIWVYDSGYDLDTDNDGLVDAIDPDPNVDQRLYFTDTDSDGVADVYDKFPNENDFNMSDDTDANNNGIVDSIEQ